MARDFDFSGYATRNDLLCGDGRTIRKNAFKDQDGCVVPLIWMHKHDDPDAVLGHALLENRDDGVYAYCKFNETENGQHCKQLVKHGDVRSLSIWANKLKQIGGDVVHGKIRELSLVLAGANPGAFIDSVMAHGDGGEEEMCINYDESALILYHSDENENKAEKGEQTVAEETKKNETVQDSEETIADVFNTLSEKQKTVVYAMIGQALEDAGKEDNVKHSDDNNDDDETIADVFNTLSEKQKTVVYAMIGQALEDNENVKHSDEEFEGGNQFMKHNVFDPEPNYDVNVISHDEMKAIFDDAKRLGSLREAVISHGVEDIDILFPDAQNLSRTPELIKRDDDWVAKVLNGVHHSPFARVKTVFADITAEEARAKGYTKGNFKLEEVIKLLKRVTGPTTVYKKQKLDRDDITDIVDLDIVPFLKQEIRLMLNAELAQAYLIGDGRSEVSEDKINEDCIRPIWKMEDLFTVKVPVTVTAATSTEDRAKAFITACVKSRKLYKGSGNPSMFMPEDMLTDCMLIEDKNGRVIYETEDKLRARLRVKEIIPVPVMENQTRTVDGKLHTLAGIYVNLQDYNVGTNKGGEINMFDDFDIDYNQYKYLMETRCSGTLTKPFSAVALEFVEE